MENLTINNTSNGFDLESMTDEQLELITNRALFLRQKKQEERITELTNNQKKLEENARINEEKLDETATELKKTKEFINVLGFSVNSYKLQILKGKAASRVYSLFNNDVSSIEFIVWNTYFFKKIYSDIAHHFHVNKCANINVKDFEKACILADEWLPTDYYIREKIEEMKNKVMKGTLKQERVMALNMYLKSTNNGEINPFTA
ncbi:MAG: ORF6C domain-containing protein [Lachnospiraceae bacterium]|nr:ORF6C domain-containing protein [Lachnospiraceae bacterium]